MDGWDNAAKITGKDPKKVTTGDKVAASIAGFMSGATFGFVKPETMHKLNTRFS